MSVRAMEWVAEIRVGKATYKAVLVALANFHNARRDECSPGIDTIAQFTELNRKTVMPALDWLREAGFISFEKGNRRHRKYTLNFDCKSPKVGTMKKPDPSENFSGGGHSNNTNGGTIENEAQSPNDGTKAENPIVPSTTSHSPKNDSPKSQRLDHEQENRLTGITLRRNEVPTVDPPDQPDYLRAAHAMWEKIQPIKRRANKPNFETWAKHIRHLVELDGIDPETVWRVFEWANRDAFWRPNILSPQKLREKFDTLYARMTQEASHGPHRQDTRKPENPRRLSAVERVKRARYGGGA